MPRVVSAAICALALSLLPITGIAAPLIAKVDISSQTLTVFQDGVTTHTWPVSTARSGKWTPRGSFTAQWLSKYHKSSLYNNAPMPYAIFFRGNYAIHGTNQVSRLGRPASAGCVRLHPENAAVLFELTQAVGKENLQVVIEN
ncbi:MAG: L,D-transpeptidase [Pelagimonas sp.]